MFYSVLLLSSKIIFNVLVEGLHEDLKRKPGVLHPCYFHVD